jgi:hypothetical protein
MFRPLLTILRRDIQLTIESYYTHNGSVVLRALYTAKLQFLQYVFGKVDRCSENRLDTRPVVL